jgi:SAM-dependent methyltransferase
VKVRDSGMPDESAWEGFFDASRVLELLGFSHGDADIVDFGCGYGTFTVAAARLTTGVVHAFDIEPDMVQATHSRAESLGIRNIRAIQRDFVAEGTGLRDGTAGFAMLFNILHAEHPFALLEEACRVLMPGGRVGIIHWIHDRVTPRGPDLDIRPRPADCQDWLRTAGFELAIPLVALPPWHYGMTGRKPG